MNREIPTLSTFEQAMAIGQPILDVLVKKLQTQQRVVPQGPLMAPWHISKGSTPWEMSIPALKHTLQYVMNDLNHPCYLFCRSWDGKTQFYKLETKKTAARVKWAVQNLYKAKDDPTTTKKRNQLLQQLDKGNTMPYRIMQCIVKPFSNQFSWEYEKWTRQWPLPPGVYLLNLTDAILLRKDFRDPFLHSFLPDKKIDKGPFIPILSLSGHVDYWDIPIPNYDDMMFTFPHLNTHQEMVDKVAGFTTEWLEKTKDTVVFRGSSSGCGVSPETNTRIRLIQYASKNKNKSDFLDVGLTAGKKGKMLLDPIQGFVLTREPENLVGFKSMAEQSQHKYILHIDGNVLAYRLLYSLLTGSVLFL